MLSQDPAGAEAWRLLALIAHQRGAAAEVVAHLRSAIEHAPGPELHCDLGIALIAAHRSEEAEVAFRQAIAINGRFLPAYLHLARMLETASRREESERVLRQAVAAAPEDAAAPLSLGMFLEKAGRFGEAEQSFRAALARAPHNAEIANRLSATLVRLGQREAAANLLRRIVETAPDHAPAALNLGGVLIELGRLDEALAILDRALALEPDRAQAHAYRGTALMRLGREAEAERAFRLALDREPDHADALNNLGVILKNQNFIAEAERRFRAAIAAAPDYAEAHSNLGGLLQARGDLAEAEQILDAAVKHNPKLADAWNNLGLLQQKLGRAERAAECFEKAIELDPKAAEALLNLAALRYEQDEFAASIALSDRAIALRPSNAKAHWNRALALLTSGKYERGWSDYEWRWQIPELVRDSGTRPTDHVWLGEEVSGKTVLLRAEQGFGDSIQFVRFAPLAAARGARVILAAQPSLVPLFKGIAGVSELVEACGPLPDYQLETTLPSLPHLFRVGEGSIPAAEGYLRAEPALAHLWRARLSERARLKVGLVWAGNPRHPNDHHRSIPLKTFAPLLERADIAFFGLQTGISARNIEILGLQSRIRDLAPWLTNFAETAAAIAALDLVVTVDTAVAHLAGALGRPVWLLLGRLADWRWMRGREDSPWYRSARLIRQSEPGDWGDVIERVARDLERA